MTDDTCEGTPSGPGTTLGGPVGPRARAAGRAAVRITVAVVAGGLLHLAFPPHLTWWTAVVAFALLWQALGGIRVRTAAVVGFAFGAAFYLAHLVWLDDFLGSDYGPFPWVGLSLLMATFTALGCACIPLVKGYRGAPVWGAVIFVGQEWLQSRFPLNGLPWGRGAVGQVEGPLLPLAAIGGAPLVSLAVVAAGFSAGAMLSAPRGRPHHLPTAVAVVVLVLATTSWAPSPPPTPADDNLTVAVIQGNAPEIGLGLFEAGATLRRNHLAETTALVERVRDGELPRPGLVVWPESSTSITGTDDEVAAAVDAADAPFLIGAYRTDGTKTENTVVTWTPGSGPGDHYAKQELVPFGERVPLRPLSEYLTPFTALADLTPGTEPAVLDIAGTRVALGICYEAAYDWVVREGVAGGGRLIVIPTNNAWYGRGEMTYQHLAMARLRAVEHGRAAVVAALSGVSALVRPDGSLVTTSDVYTTATLVEQLPLRSETTVATRWGSWVENGLALLGAATALVALRRRIIDRDREPAVTPAQREASHPSTEARSP